MGTTSEWVPAQPTAPAKAKSRYVCRSNGLSFITGRSAMGPKGEGGKEEGMEEGMEGGMGRATATSGARKPLAAAAAASPSPLPPPPPPLP